MLEVTQQPRQHHFTWPSWRLEFCWHADRWQHVLWRSGQAGWQRCLHSVEGNSSETWPPSPAFQNAYIERISDACAEIQLLGQAGKNHYSGAVRCDSVQQIVDFDLAVRLPATPTDPVSMSTYHFESNAPSDLRTVWDLTTESITGQPPVIVDWDNAISTPIPSLRLKMTDWSESRQDKHRVTLRWKYQWRFKPIA